MKSLAKDPKGRWQTADEFSTALGKGPGMTARGKRATNGGSDRPEAELCALGASRVVLRSFVGAALVSSGRKKETATIGPAPVATTTKRWRCRWPRRMCRESARRHLSMAIGYSQRLWCSDAIEELDKALRDDGALKDDPLVVRTAIVCLREKTRERAIRLLVERVGAGARGELERATYERTQSRKCAKAHKWRSKRLPR